MPESMLQKNRNTIIVTACVVIILLPFVVGLLATRGGEAATFLEKAQVPEGWDRAYCVATREYPGGTPAMEMRFHHWEILRNMRERVVRFGDRGSLEDRLAYKEPEFRRCRDCHQSRENFCNRCHDAVSLYPDCYDCHYYP